MLPSRARVLTNQKLHQNLMKTAASVKKYCLGFMVSYFQFVKCSTSMSSSRSTKFDQRCPAAIYQRWKISNLNAVLSVISNGLRNVTFT